MMNSPSGDIRPHEIFGYDAYKPVPTSHLLAIIVLFYGGIVAIGVGIGYLIWGAH